MLDILSSVAGGLYIIAKSVTLYKVYGEQLSNDCIASGGWPFRVSYRMPKKRLNFAVITFRKFSSRKRSSNLFVAYIVNKTIAVTVEISVTYF